MTDRGEEFSDRTVDTVTRKEREAGVQHGDRANNTLRAMMEAGEPVALTAVILFDLVGIFFGLGERHRSRDVSIGRIIISINMGGKVRIKLHQALSGGKRTIANDPPQELPYPEFLVFFKRKLRISSISTSRAASLRPCWCGAGVISALALTQRITDCAVTPSTSPILFNVIPHKCRIIAKFLTASGFPWLCSCVKLYPHPTHL
jgi:hypothetical protein